MVTSSTPPVSKHRLARQVREQFVNHLDASIVELMGQIQRQLAELARGSGRGGSIASMQLSMDASVNFQRERQAWVAAVRRG